MKSVGLLRGEWGGGGRREEGGKGGDDGGGGDDPGRRQVERGDEGEKASRRAGEQAKGVYDLQHLPRSGELRLRLRGCRASHVLRVVRAEASGAAPIVTDGCPAPLSAAQGGEWICQTHPNECRAKKRGS